MDTHDRAHFLNHIVILPKLIVLGQHLINTSFKIALITEVECKRRSIMLKQPINEELEKNFKELKASSIRSFLFFESQYVS